MSIELRNAKLRKNRTKMQLGSQRSFLVSVMVWLLATTTVMWGSPRDKYPRPRGLDRETHHRRRDFIKSGRDWNRELKKRVTDEMVLFNHRLLNNWVPDNYIIGIPMQLGIGLLNAGAPFIVNHLVRNPLKGWIGGIGNFFATPFEELWESWRYPAPNATEARKRRREWGHERRHDRREQRREERGPFWYRMYEHFTGKHREERREMRQERRQERKEEKRNGGGGR